MKRYIKTDTESGKDRRFYLFALLDALGLQYEGKEAWDQHTPFGTLSYRIKGKGGRYFLDVWIDNDADPAQVWNAIDECIFNYRIPNVHHIKYDPNKPSHGYSSTLYMSLLRDIPVGA